MKDISYTINAHSSIRMDMHGKIIYFDPFAFDEGTSMHDADFIFITHTHYDHFSPNDIEKVANKNTFFIAPTCMESELRAIGVSKEFMHLVTVGEHFIIAQDISCEAIAAYNIKQPFHPKKEGFVGYILSNKQTSVYVAGDTDNTAEARAVRADIAFLPVGGTYTMNPAEAAELIRAIEPRIAIPTHYGSVTGKETDGEEFATYVNQVAPKTKVDIILDGKLQK